jgi:hypothetical protein
MKEFAKAHDELKAAPRTPPRSSPSWRWWSSSGSSSRTRWLRAAGDQKKAASDVATTSERILEQMDLVVSLYEKLAS